MQPNSDQTSRSASSRGGQRLMLAALLLVLFGSALLRIHHLDSRGMGHTEIYTPNIELPSDYGNPRARLTLVRTIVNSLWEPHPPGWYVFTWAWTKLAGTSLVAIRLPGALFGVLAVLLTFALGRMETDSLTALVGATLVGFNAHQILWSQVSRPSTLLCALALLSTILLLLAMRQASRRYAWLYVAVVVAGLSIEHYFWLLLAGQIAFCVLRLRTDPLSAPSLIRYQLLAIIVGGPLLTLIVFQSGGATYLESDAVSTTSDMVAFGFLVEHDLGRALEIVDRLRPALAILGGTLAVIGLWKFGSRSAPHQTSGVPLAGPPIALTAAMTVVSCGGMLATAVLLARGHMASGKMLATLAVPCGALVAAYVLQRYSGAVSAVFDRFLPRGTGLPATVVILIGPLTLAAVLSQFKPLLASRHLLMLVPFLLLLIAKGMVRIGSFRPRWISVAALVICTTSIAGAYVLGYQYQSTARPGPHDYRGLAEAWIPRIEASDVILVRDHFRTTPIFYYMKPSRFNFVGLNYVSEVRRRSPPRVWVLSIFIGGSRSDPAMDEAVAGYRLVSEVSSRGMRAELYERKNVP